MLYKNDKIYEMTNEDHRAINKRYPKFPIRLIYPDARVRPSRSKHNRLPDKPNSISFPLLATVETNKGPQNWRYATNKIIGTDGQTIWQPHNLILRGSMMLKDTDIELVFWLVKCCPFLEGGENFNGRVAKCVIEDLRGSAEKKALKEEEMATVKAMIYSSKMGLGEKKLRLVAKAYFVPGVNELSFAQVKLAVESTIERDKNTGVQRFLDLVDAEQVIQVRSNLQSAVDRKLITFMVTNKQWAWETGQGRKNEPICQIGAGADPSEALYDYYLGNRGFAQELEAALKGKKVVVAAGAGGPDDDLDQE